MENNNRVDHANPFTNQIFQEAVTRNDMAVVKLLLRFGIYPKRNERNRQGLTALQQCVLDGKGRMTILLLEAGADIEAKTSNGWTCLHIASALGDLDILTTLVNHCCDLVALTKNEELPIDLAASRDIKIKLAKEMSRVGYSELAQWYMRKLAAREGVFYVLSTDTLLDLACDDKQERNYNDDYLYYVRQYNNQQRDMYINSPVRKPDQNSFRVDASPKNDMWLEGSSQQQMTYLTFSSSHLSEVVFDPSSSQYCKSLSSATAASAMESPQRKQVLEEKTSLASISEVDGPYPPNSTVPMEESKSRSGTLKRTSSSKRHSKSDINRKQSTIELHIDYSHTTESESESDDDNKDVEKDGAHQNTTTSNRRQVGNHTDYQHSSASGHPFKTYERVGRPGLERAEEHNRTSNDTLIIKESMTLSQRNNALMADAQEQQEFMKTPVMMNTNSAGLKTRNVKFNPGDTNNEFCNCPTCKKLGYAFSPDIQIGSRKEFHVPVAKPTAEMMPSAVGYNQFYYPETTTEKEAMYYEQGGGGFDYKPRKRKKKLFSGIKSMFKDSIKVRTNMENQSPACDDAGILFSVSVRDKNKAKQIRQRQEVRRSNSWSNSHRVGGNDLHQEDEVNVLSHSQVVAPPHSFSDIYHPQERELIDRDVYNKNVPAEFASSRSNLMEYGGRQQQQSIHYPQQYLHHNDEVESKQARSLTSRNTYEQNQTKGISHKGGTIPRPLTADEVLYCADDDINAHCDNSTTTLPHGFHFSRAPIPVLHQSSQQIPMEHPKRPRAKQQQHPACNNHVPSSFDQMYPTTHFQHVHNNKETHQHAHPSSTHEYNGAEQVTKKGRKDNCDICNTKSAAPIAGAVPMSVLIE